MVSWKDMGESELKFSPDNKKFLLYNHLKNKGWFGAQRSEVIVFNVGANYRLTSNYLVDSIHVAAGITVPAQSAEFSDDSRFIYCGADRLTLTGSPATSKDLSRYDTRNKNNALVFQGHNGNLRRGLTTKIYQDDTLTQALPAYYEDNTGLSVQALNSVAFTTPIAAGYNLTGVLPLQNHKVYGDLLQSLVYLRTVGDKSYELSDHLGNVTVLVSDLKYASWSGATLSNSAEVTTFNNYYAFGMLMPGRTLSPADYRYGFNGKEKDDELKGVGNSYDYGARIYDSRLARWLSVDPLAFKFQDLTPYNFVANTPISAVDPDGRDIIFINGFSPHDTHNRFRGGALNGWRRRKYWDNSNPNFTKNVANYFNDYKHHFLSASEKYGSRAIDRQRLGYETALQMVKSGEIKLSEDNPITVVMHSQGNAYGIGFMQGILQAAKEAKINVKVNGVMLSVHQPNDIDTKDVADKSIQFSYNNDNAAIIAPIGKVKGVADANAGNKVNDEDGLEAHSATVDKDEAFEAIKKVDRQKKIFTKKKSAK